MLIDAVSAILLISDDAPRLAAFYRDTLELPLADEVHDDTPPHFGCEIGDVHFAIHPSEGWPGKRVDDGQSPVIALATRDVARAAEKLRAAGIEPNGPFDHGFANTVSFRDPDGNLVEVLQFK